MSTTTRAAVVESGGAPFTLSDVELDEPRADEVARPDGRRRPVPHRPRRRERRLPFPLPGVLGHEGAGVVEAVGAGRHRRRARRPRRAVLHLLRRLPQLPRRAPGVLRDLAAAEPPRRPPGRRHQHRSAGTARRSAGTSSAQSSFAERALVDERSLVKVDPDVPLESLAPLGCGVQTGVGAVWNVLKPRHRQHGRRPRRRCGRSVGRHGRGPDPRDRRSSPSTGSANGSTLARSWAPPTPSTRPRPTSARRSPKITGGQGADGVVETTGNVGVLRQGVDALAARGTAGRRRRPAVRHRGRPGRQRDARRQAASSASPSATAETQTLIPALVDLVKEGRLPLHRLISTYPFADIDQAVAGHDRGQDDQAGADVLSMTGGGNQGLGSWPRRRARISPAAEALTQGTRRLTYEQLADRVARWASALRDLGVKRGDRVAWLGANDIATFEAFFATGLLGAIFVPLNTRLAAVELRYMLEDCGASVLITGEGVVQEVGEQVPVSSIELGEPLVDEPDVHLDEPALILYTSGTTGKPKGAVLTHGNLTWNTFNELVHFDLTDSERALCIAPLFHAVGLGQITLPTLLKGGRVEVVTKFDAGAILKLISEQRVTSFSCVPTMLQLMTEHPAWADADLSSLRHVVYGGSTINESVAKEWLNRGVRILQGYGMTEASPASTWQSTTVPPNIAPRWACRTSSPTSPTARATIARSTSSLVDPVVNS